MVRKPRSESEVTLIARLQAGDADAVAELSALYGTRIFQLAYRWLHNHEDAQELTQDVLVIVWRRIQTFRSDAALSSWIHRITFNAAMSRLRRLRRCRKIEQGGFGRWPLVMSDAELSSIEPLDWSPAADEVLVQNETRARLYYAMRFIPPIVRECLVLRDLHGLSTEEASRVLRVTPQAVKSRMHRGRRMLKQRLEILEGIVAEPAYTGTFAPPRGPTC
jgi:RNA polymerase sigma-70 factor (ECF subfamily)